MSVIDTEPSPIIRERCDKILMTTHHRLRDSGIVTRFLGPVPSLLSLFEGDPMAEADYTERLRRQMEDELDRDYQDAVDKGRYVLRFIDPPYNWANDPDMSTLNDSSVDTVFFSVIGKRSMPSDQIPDLRTDRTDVA